MGSVVGCRDSGSAVVAKVIVLALVLAAAALLLPTRAAGEHEKYRYKFPCVPADICYVTQLAHTGNAIDFDPRGSAGLGTIPLVSEGEFVGYVTASTSCTWPGGSGLGMYAVVEDIHGRTLRYAHLSSFGGLDEDERVFQGDTVGVEGNTGYSINCAPHLHLEAVAGLAMDGNSTISLGAYSSTNSYVSGTSAPAQAIRTVFKDYAIYLNTTSWNLFGWTSDITGGQAGCGGWAFCQLYIHYEPNPVNGYWGSIVQLRRHPATYLYEDGNQAWEYNAIMAERIRVGLPGFNYQAYWVRQPLHRAWFLTNFTQRIGLPIMAEVDDDVWPCSASPGCIAYQRFSHGYVWQHSSTGIHAVFCPDVNGPGASIYTWPDHVISLADDILGTIQAYGTLPPSSPYAPWPNGRFDLNGDGVIDLANDILGVISHYLQTCYP